jgi:hypothetical protein
MPARFIAADLAERKPDDRIHKAAPSEERADFRSATPLGFSRAVFEANRRQPIARSPFAILADDLDGEKAISAIEALDRSGLTIAAKPPEQN